MFTTTLLIHSLIYLNQTINQQSKCSIILIQVENPNEIDPRIPVETDPVSDLSAKLLKEFFKLHPMEKVRHLISHFRVFPTVSLNPVTGSTDISFQPGADGVVCLEDVFSLMEDVHTDSDRLIVVLDEFQEIREMGANLDKQLRSIMQRHKHINYILLGNQESMSIV